MEKKTAKVTSSFPSKRILIFHSFPLKYVAKMFTFYNSQSVICAHSASDIKRMNKPKKKKKVF